MDKTSYTIGFTYSAKVVILRGVRTNLIARVSQIQGHEIRIVLYTRLDDDD